MATIIVKRCLLQSILERKRITPTQLADMTGLSTTQISDYTRNKRGMSLKNAYLISYYLRCHAEELYEWVVIE